LDSLSINCNETKLLKQVEELKEKSKDNDFIIKRKLEEKDELINKLKKK